MQIGATLLFYAPPVLVALAALEALVLRLRRGRYDWRAALASFGDFVGRQYIVYALIPAGLAGPAIAWAWTHRVWTVPLDTVSAFIALFIGQEFCYYWFHRTSHRVRWFWATHAVHHSPSELNLSAAYRFGLTGRISGSSIFYVPLIWLGFPPAAVFTTLSVNLLYQFWLHTDWTPKLGWLEYVLNTPSHHRVHHAANPDYLDANYGGVLIVFDRLFGTLIVERDDLPCRYGLTKPLLSHNPLWIAVHEWVAMAQDVWSATTWRERFWYVFGPPGWRADGSGGTTEELRALSRPSGAPAGAA